MEREAECVDITAPNRTLLTFAIERRLTTVEIVRDVSDDEWTFNGFGRQEATDMLAQVGINAKLTAHEVACDDTLFHQLIHGILTEEGGAPIQGVLGYHKQQLADCIVSAHAPNSN
jgi:hypothetical protein